MKRILIALYLYMCIGIASMYSQTVIPLAGFQATVEAWPITVNDSIMQVRLTINDYSNQFSGTDLVGRDHIVLWRNCKRYPVVSLDTVLANYVVIKINKNGNPSLLPGVCALLQETSWIVSHLINGVTQSDKQCIDSYYRNNNGGGGGSENQKLYYGGEYPIAGPVPLYITDGDTVMINSTTGITTVVDDSTHMTIHSTPPYGHMNMTTHLDNDFLADEEKFPFVHTLVSNCSDMTFDAVNNRLVVSSTAGGYYRLAYDMDVQNGAEYKYLGLDIYVKVNGTKVNNTNSNKYLGNGSGPTYEPSNHIGRNQFIYLPNNAYVELWYKRNTGNSNQVYFYNIMLSLQFVSKINCTP